MPAEGNTKLNLVVLITLILHVNVHTYLNGNRAGWLVQFITHNKWICNGAANSISYLLVSTLRISILSTPQKLHVPTVNIFCVHMTNQCNMKSQCSFKPACSEGGNCLCYVIHDSMLIHIYAEILNRLIFKSTCKSKNTLSMHLGFTHSSVR